MKKNFRKIFGGLSLVSKNNPHYPHGFDKKPISKHKPYYKVYNDGGHFIAQSIVKSKRKNKVSTKDSDDILKNSLFDSYYYQGLQLGLKRDDLKAFVQGKMCLHYKPSTALDSYIEKRTERVISNLHKRKKRLKRKINMHKWNYFVTITYSDTLHTEDTFRKKLRKCFSNLHTRRGWKYIGVFERGGKTNRLHFHAIVYIPPSETIGKTNKITDYDTENGEVQVSYENTFFKENYGKNDFKELNQVDMKNGRTLNYLIKYIGKSNERIVFSRGIPDIIYKQINDNDIIVRMQDFITKYVLFDDVIDYERDILLYKPKQINIWGAVCNPT